MVVYNWTKHGREAATPYVRAKHTPAIFLNLGLFLVDLADCEDDLSEVFVPAPQEPHRA